MTAPAVTIRPTAAVWEAARMMTERRVNRLPVVDPDGRLLGIVTRADLVRAFTRSDEELRREIADDVLLHTLWIATDRLTIGVEDGVVTLAGETDNHTSAKLAEAYIRRVPGVLDVRSELTWAVDDLAARTRHAASELPVRV
jgi:CBS domain-containing protein